MRAKRGPRALLVWALAVTSLVGCSLDIDYLASGADGGGAVDPGSGSDATWWHGDAGSAETDGLMTTSADESGATLVQNSSFESGLAPWIAWDNATIATTTLHAHSGMWSAHVSGRTHTYQGPVQALTTGITAGSHYNGTAWAMVAMPAATSDAGADAGAGAGAGAGDGAAAAGDAGTTSGADAGDSGGSDGAGTGAPTLEQPTYLTAKIGCAADGSINYSFVQLGSATANNATWTLISGGLTVPSCDLASLSIYVEGPAAGVDLYVDDVNVW